MGGQAGDRPPDRSEQLGRIERREYDLAVIGGGIAGAGVARDAAMRGLDVVLLERTDFAAGTTAGTTRLIHGGLRYLEQFEFPLVFESLREREILHEIAPHLVDPLCFLIPQYDTGRLGRLKVGLGMYLYDLLAVHSSMPGHERLSSSDLLELEPDLPDTGLSGGFAYHDRQAEFVERLCVETVLDASRHGADVLNHAEATSVRVEGGTACGVGVSDSLRNATIEVDCSAVVNAAGPWAEAVIGDLAGDASIRPTKGVHLVVPQLTEHALTLPTTDGRVIFVVPWNGFALLGTTDTEFGDDPATARATAEDVAYLLDEARRFFPWLDESDVHYTYAAIRPLYDEGGGKDASAVSRRHRVVDHAGAVDGLFSLIGAKVTPHRAAAEDATDVVCDYLGRSAGCRTVEVALPGARGDRSIEGDAPPATIDHLERVLGTRADAVLDRAEAEPRLLEPLCPHTEDVLGQVTLAVEAEFARTVADVLLRRCTVGFARCEGRDAVGPVADHMAELLGWDATRRTREIERYEAIIDRRHAWQGEEPGGSS